MSHRCKPTWWMYRRDRVTRVPNLLRGHMYTQPCRCGALVPIEWPLGSKAKPAGRGEMRLARAIAKMETTFEPCRWRSQEIDRLATSMAVRR